MPRPLLHLLLLSALCLPLVHCTDDQNNELPPIDPPTADATDDDGADEPPDQVEDETSQEPTQLEIPEGPWDISKPGPYNAGFDTAEITYEAAPGQRARTLRVAIWYPTRALRGRTAARYAGLIVRPEGKLEAPIEPEGTFPVLLFSHGNAALAEQSFYLTEYFAQHGWVVLSPDHTENTFKDTDGSVNYSSAMDRPQDISAVLDWALSRPQGHFLHERLTDDIALAGHSFGGYTTLAVAGGTFPTDDIVAFCDANPATKECQAFTGPASVEVYKQGFLDPRIKAAIPQTPAGAFFFGEGLSNIAIPTLLMTGALDSSLKNEEEGDPIWANLPENSGQNIRLDFNKGGHFTFSNMCTLFGFIDLVKDDGCGSEFIEVDVALDIIRQYTLAFTQKHLLGDTRHDALLSGDSQPWMQHLVFQKK